LDFFFIPYKKREELNLYYYPGVSSVVAIAGLAWGYFYQFDYVIEVHLFDINSYDVGRLFQRGKAAIP
jgi:hypothetical protein